MTALPDWIENLESHPFRKSQAREALAIAWEALEYAAEDRTEHLHNLTWVGQRAVDAMRRIEELGEE
jgi:hypothetical protein